MAKVKFTRHLVRFFPSISDNMTFDGQTVAEVLKAVDAEHPGLAHYIANERGQLRKHVNIFLDGELIQDREALSDNVSTDSLIYFFQALSGG